MSEKNQAGRDPREREAKPPYPAKPQDPPGTESQLEPRADHGEKSYRGNNKLTGKVAIITGGDSGIGRAVALAFAREGADVLISYLVEHEDAAETKRVCEAEGRRALTVAGDIGDEQHCQALVRRASEELGGLDILVNNAAFQRTHDSPDELSAQEVERTFRTNVFAMFHLSKAALGVMRKGGAIINTTSIQAFQPSPTLLAYASTKGAIVTYTKALAKAAMKQGIRVNAVAPGPVWTPLIPSTMPPDAVKKFGQDSLLGRAAQPAELAPVYVFLASNDASFVTGMVYGVTGGELF